MSFLPKESKNLLVSNRFFGKSGYNEADKSYTSTLWVTFLLFPIYPLKSYRVVREKNIYNPSVATPGVTVAYSVLNEVPINKKQTTKTRLWSLLFLAIIIYFFYLLFTIGKK